MAENETGKVNVIDLLLRPDAPAVTRERKLVEMDVKRLSESFGEPFTVTIKGLSYNEYQDLKDAKDATVDIVLAGVVSPNLRDPRLLEMYGVPTPVELAKDIFLPGELAELARKIEQLTGFRQLMLKEVKKN